MLGKDFYNNVMSHSELEWLGVREGSSSSEGEALVCHTQTGIKHAISVSSILEHPWTDLEAVLTGKREARLMTHLTRIVGYWSRTANWNKSKLAELADRQKGDYSFPESATKLRRNAPTTGALRTKQPAARLSAVIA